MELSQEKVNYIGAITLTNSDKIGFTRRDLGLCFFPQKIVEKADRIYKSLVVDGARTHEDNPLLVRKLWEIIPKPFIYNGTVKRITCHSFNWGPIANRICRDWNLADLRIKPDRGNIVRTIEIKSSIESFSDHTSVILSFLRQLRQGNKQLTFDVPNCTKHVIAACPTR